MRFFITLLFLLMASITHAKQIMMKCEGPVIYKFNSSERQGKVIEKVLKYEDTLFGNPKITIRKSGAWKPWCGAPLGIDVKSNTLKMGEMGGACFTITENDTFYGELNHVVDFILQKYSVESDIFTRKATNEAWSAEADWDCELLD